MNNTTTQEFRLISYEEWLRDQVVISKHSDYAYSICFKGIICGVGVSECDGDTFVTVRPMNSGDDIGGGAGTPIDFKFKDKKSTTQEDNANAVEIQLFLNKIYNQAIDHALDIVSASSALNFGNQDEMETYIVERLEKLKS